MGAGPARCKKCNKGYRRDGAKCLGERPLRAGGGGETPHNPHTPSPSPSCLPADVDECAGSEEPVCSGVQEVCENTEGGYRCVCAQGHVRRDGQCVEEKPPGTDGIWGVWGGGHQRGGPAVPSLSGAALADAPEKGFFDDVTEDEVVVLQQMFFGVMICALATLAAKGDMVFTAIFIGAVAAMAGYWLSDRSDRVLDGFMKGR